MREVIKMKIRNGFVSNSSTSNFLIFGVKAPYTENIEEKVDTFNKQFDVTLDILFDDGSDVHIGRVFYDVGDGEEIGDLEIDHDSLNEMADEIKEHSKEFEETFGVEPSFKLRTGTRSS
jgi:hypothetical protein